MWSLISTHKSHENKHKSNENIHESCEDKHKSSENTHKPDEKNPQIRYIGAQCMHAAYTLCKRYILYPDTL